MKIIRLSERRRERQGRADRLDRAIDESLVTVAVPEDFTAELDAARRMAESHLPMAAPSEGLVALRAALAARRSSAVAQARSRWLVQGVPGAVAAVSVGLAVFFGLRAQPGLAGAQTAAAALREMNVRMQAVNGLAASNDLSGVVQAAQSARASLVAAQQVAEPLPADDPLKDVLLQSADAKIAELEALLAQLRLPPVASLPSVPTTGSHPATALGTESGLAPGSTSTSTTAGASGSGSTTTSSTSTSTSTSTTSTTQGSSASSTTTTSAGGSQTATTPTTKPTPSTTTTSSTTTSTTPVPPPPSTTTTTAPSPPPGQ